MSKQQLDGAQIGSSFQQMSGKGMAQTMGSDAFGDAGAMTGYLASLLNGAVADRFAGLGAREEPEGRTGLLPPGRRCTAIVRALRTTRTFQRSRSTLPTSQATLPMA